MLFFQMRVTYKSECLRKNWKAISLVRKGFYLYAIEEYMKFVLLKNLGSVLRNLVSNAFDHFSTKTYLYFCMHKEF